MKQTIKVVGLSFRPVRVELKPNYTVRLIKEPDNKFDPDAVKVQDLAGNMLGYVGKDDPYRPFVLASDEPVEVKVLRANYHAEGDKMLWKMIQVGDLMQLWLEAEVASLKDDTYELVTSFTGEEVYWSEFHHICLDKEGNKLLGGSSYAKDKVGSRNFDAVATNYAASHNLDKQVVLDYWDSLKTTAGGYGTSIHKAMEHYAKYEPIVGHEMALPRQRHLKNVVENFLERSDMKRCEVEPLITDVQMGMSGWVDLLRFISDKTVWVEDYKTAEADPAKLKTKLKEYVHQLNFYGTILQNHGYTVEKIVVWHWYDGNWTPYSYPFTPVTEYMR